MYFGSLNMTSQSFIRKELELGHAWTEISDPYLLDLYQKVESGERFSLEDGLHLYRSHDLIGVGTLARMARERQHGRKTFYVYNQHLNYTNVCVNGCAFCAYSRTEGEIGAFTLTLEEIAGRIEERIREPIREIHIVGGINPSLPFSYYIDLLRTVKRLRPNATLKAFTPVEIDAMGRWFGMTVQDVLSGLKEAGLEMMPGGGAEILDDRIQQRLYPRKIGPTRWLEVVRSAHDLGIKTNATMLYGHIESDEQRVTHLLRLRSLQDETGGILAFIPLAFHPENTGLSNLSGTTAVDDLKTVAAARLILDNVPHIKAYWVMISPALSQVAMSFGADDLDGTVIDERITHSAGARTPKGLGRHEIRHLIEAAGFLPVERDAFYNPV
jgi:aminodeoxyfutalosine synthase